MEDFGEYATESGPPIPARIKFLGMISSTINSWARRPDGTLNRRISNLLEIKAPPASSSNGGDEYGVSSKDLSIDSQPHPEVWARIYSPSQTQQHNHHHHPDHSNHGGDGSINVQQSNHDGDGSAVSAAPKSMGPMPIILHYHGGGFAQFSPDCRPFDAFCRRLCSTCHAAVVSVHYRRSPEHKCPAAYDDSFAALAWIRSPAVRAQLPPTADVSKCIILGDSAGGNIVHHIGCRAAEAAGDLHPVGVVGHALLFPAFGGEGRTASEIRLADAPIARPSSADWCWRAFLPPGANRDHPACNVLGPNAPPLSGLQLPPTLVLIAEYDALKDWQIEYVRGLQRAGKDVQLLYYKGGVHSFHLIDNSQRTSDLLSDLQSWISQRCR